MKIDYKIFVLNEVALTIILGSEISFELHQKNLAIKEQIENENWPWLLEIIPSYTSVSIFVKKEFYFFHASLEAFFAQYFLEKINLGKPKVKIESIKEIPIKYNGIDLEFVSQYTCLSIPEIIQKHSSTIYTVGMIGFLPGFPYLIGMDASLFVPRRNSPRKLVEKGSVGIAGNQTGIYSLESPGGWQIIGKTEKELFSINNLSFLKIGDKVKFKPC